MPLIDCPDCRNKVSDKARICPNCGYPFSDIHSCNDVSIKIPNDILDGFEEFFSSKRASVFDMNGNLLWIGMYGETARFITDLPMNIKIDLGIFANEIYSYVEPKKRYVIVQDKGIHIFSSFRLKEDE